MAARGYFIGHPIVFRNDQWIYEDTGKPTATTWKERPCGYCGLGMTDAGHDGCLGTLPGLMNACCGHGAESEAYVQFADGFVISGRQAMAIISAYIGAWI